MNITTLAKRTCLLLSLIITPAAWAVEMVPASRNWLPRPGS